MEAGGWVSQYLIIYFQSAEGRSYKHGGAEWHQGAQAGKVQDRSAKARQQNPRQGRCLVRKPLCNTSAVQMEFCQLAFQPPHPQAPCGNCRKSVNFDNDYGQTLFLDGILMDIMIDNGEIWCKLSVLVMVYIHWRTPTFHLEWVFNPPPLRRNSVWTALLFRWGLPYSSSSRIIIIIIIIFVPEIFILDHSAIL